MSAASLFEDFVERQRRSVSEAAAMDWEKVRDDWLGHLESLYDLISDYLKDYVDRNAIELRHSTVELNEENIGVYTAKRLTILIGAQQIVLTPIGTLLIGAKGRVDVEGSGGTSRLVLVSKGMADPGQAFRVTVTTAPRGMHPAPSEAKHLPPSSDPIEWAWKIVSRPPALQFVDLNEETLFEMLMEVSGG